MKNKKSKNTITANPHNLTQRPRRLRCLTILLQAEAEKKQKKKSCE